MKLRHAFAMLLLGTALTSTANPITRSQARVVAQELVGISDTTPDDVPVAPYYIFSRGAGKGFVIVSGDDTTVPILGYTEQGDYDESQLPPQLQGMLGSWGKAIAETQARHEQPIPALRRARARAIAAYKQNWVDVPALLETHWHQSTPYNNLAPVKNGQGRCMTGCVATSGSQVAYYFRRDNNTELQYDTPTYGYGTPITVSLPKGTPLKWNLMKKSGTGSAAQDSAVAVLMYALGTSAWLTYGDGEGTATSGHNYKMGEAMRGQLGLNNENRSKSEMSQQGWETLIYNNLKTRRPMLYSGANDSQGGHSVVLDGYQARTGLYHFNFGWGGQGDGWYTVDDETGMNGFNEYQDLVFNFTPQRQKLTGTIMCETVYHKAPTTIKVHVENLGTLDYSGFHLYTNTQPKVPAGSPIDSDNSTMVASDGSADLELSMTQVSKRDMLYLFLCDNNKNVLDTFEVSVTPTVADMRLEKMVIDASDEIMTADGQDYLMVNNTSVTATATLTNGPEGTYCMPSVSCTLYYLDTETGEWKNQSVRTVADQLFNQNETKDITFTFGNLKESTRYKVVMNTTVRASEKTEMQMAEGQGEIFFTVRPSDLTLTVEGRTATVSGRWNETLFQQKADDASICSYDISALTQLNTQPVAANPNALFYTSADATDLLKYDNVVAGDQCRQLVVRSGHEFLPSKAFTAEKATFVLSDLRTDMWQSILVPFAVQVPYGMQVKKAKNLEKNTLEHEYTTSIDPMTVVTYLTGRAALDSLQGTQVAIGTASEVNLFDNMLHASTLHTPVEGEVWVMGEFVGNAYYMQADASQTQVNAFSPWLSKPSFTRISLSKESAVEKNYISLAKAIASAYEAIVQKPDASAADLAALKTVLKEAEDMLTNRSHSAATDISSLVSLLNTAVSNFMNGSSDGICLLPTADEQVPATATRYYNLSGQQLQPGATKRGLVIVTKGGKTRKMLAK